MKKKLTLSLTFIFLYTFVFSQKVQKDDVGKISQQTYENLEIDSVLSIAKNQINSIIDNIPENNLSDYGFKNEDEFKKISFDHPIKIYTLQDTNIVFTSTWRIPLVIDNEYRALITIIKEKEEYKLVDFGAHVLAAKISTLKTEKTIGLLRVYELKTDYMLELTTKKQLTLIPILQNSENIVHYDLIDIISLIKKN